MKRDKTHSRSQKRPRRPQAKFPAISEQMQEWSAMLGAELDSWPRISIKSMFGFKSYYRAGKIFAALPRTRGLQSSSSFILKFDPMPAALLKQAAGDPRMDTNTRLPGRGWFSFQLDSEPDLHAALYWLSQAYEASAKRTMK